MKKTLTILTLCAAVVLLAGTASADIVSYSTTGSFSCGGASNCTTGIGAVGGPSITFGSGTNTTTIEFLGTSSFLFSSDPVVLDNGTPGNGALGTASMGYIDTIFTGGTGEAPIGGTPTFTITVTQFVPAAGSGAFVSSITGTVGVLSSTGELVFSFPGNSVVIWTPNSLTSYVLHNLDPGYVKKIPATSSGVLTSIEADVNTRSAIPEPASMTLLGSGLLGAGSFLRRKLLKR